MKYFFITLTFFLLFSAPAYAQLDKVDISKMKLYKLIVTVQGHEISGLTAADINNGIINQNSKIIILKSEIPEEIKVELEQENGLRVDITDDQRTSYKVMGSRIFVQSGKVHNQQIPIAGMQSLGLDSEGSVIIQFEDLDNQDPYKPSGTAGSVYVYFQIAE